MEIVETVKKDWPYVVGGIVGLILVFKFMGSRSAAAAPATVGTIDPQTAAIQAQQSLQSQQLSQNQQLAEDTLNAKTQIASGLNDVNYLAAQGTVAQNVGSAAGALISALDMPTIQAINGANAVDAATMQAAGSVVNTGLTADAAIVQQAGNNAQYTASVVNSSERSLAGAYIGAQSAYGQSQAAIAQAGATAQVAIANANASAAIATANANAKVQTAQAQTSSSTSSDIASIGSAAAAILPFFL